MPAKAIPVETATTSIKQHDEAHRNEAKRLLQLNATELLTEALVLLSRAEKAKPEAAAALSARAGVLLQLASIREMADTRSAIRSVAKALRETAGVTIVQEERL